MADSGQFRVHSSGGSSKGSKIGTALLVVALLVAGGGVYALWSSPPRMLSQIQARGPLAVPSAYLLSFKGIQDDAKPVLFDALENGEPALRRAAARAIGTAKSMDVVSNLGQAATQDPEPVVRGAATAAMGANGHSAADRFLSVALDDADPGVQAAACRAIGAIGLDAFIPRLIDKLDSLDGGVKAAALEALEVFYGSDEHGMQKHADAWRQWYSSR